MNWCIILMAPGQGGIFSFKSELAAVREKKTGGSRVQVHLENQKKDTAFCIPWPP